MILVTPFRGIFTLTALFSFVVLVFNLPTLGNNLTPRSLFSWACIALGLTWCGFVVLQRKSLLWQRHMAWLFLPPLAVLLVAWFSPPSPFAHYPALAFFAVLFGALWVIGLLQLQLSHPQFKQLAWLIFIGSAVLSLLTLGGPGFFGFIPNYDGLSKLLTGSFGGFQQVNNYSSFLAAITVLAFVTFMHSNDAHRPAHQVALFVLTFICGCSVWVCGSRTGYLGLCISAVLLLVWVWKFHPNQKRNLIIWLLALGLGLMVSLKAPSLGVAPQYSINERVAGLLQGSASADRMDMWLVSLSLWKQTPWFGHGLGSFTQVFTTEFDRLIASGQTLAPVTGGALTHPHNEWLLWLVETGCIGFAAVLGPWLAYVLMGVSKRPVFGLAWLACLVPIGLHTLTEFPLHSSGAHWYLLGIILAFGFSQPGVSNLGVVEKPLRMSRPVWLGTAAAWGTAGVLVTLFLIQSAYISHVAFVRFYWPNTADRNDWTTRVNSPEFFHPLLDEYAKDLFILNTADWVLESEDATAIQQWQPAVESLYKRYPTAEGKKRLEKFRAAVGKE